RSWWSKPGTRLSDSRSCCWRRPRPAPCGWYLAKGGEHGFISEKRCTVEGSVGRTESRPAAAADHDGQSGREGLSGGVPGGRDGALNTGSPDCSPVEGFTTAWLPGSPRSSRHRWAALLLQEPSALLPCFLIEEANHPAVRQLQAGDHLDPGGDLVVITLHCR